MEKFGGNFNIRLKTESGDSELQKQSLQKSLDERFKEESKNSISIEEALGQGAQEKINQLNALVKNKLKSRGIGEVNLLPLIFKKKVADKKAEDSGETVAYANPRYIVIPNMEFADPSLKQLCTLKMITHEQYHGIGQKTIIGKKEEIGQSTKQAAVGASYIKEEDRITGVNEHSYLFEEGSAVDFENEIFEDLKKTFPKETVEKYDLIMEKIKENVPESQQEQIWLYKYDNADAAIHRNKDYFEASEMVSYLRSKIPNFNLILENARIHGKILDLAKAIDGKFGEGMYRKIATAHVEEGSQILKELKEIN